MAKTPPPAEPDPAAMLPLTPAVFSILLALADGKKHGYAIMQEVAAETDGRISMGPGTLYGSLDRMMKANLVEESEEADETAPHSERRRYYRLSDFGRRVLRAEVRRLEQALAVARRKKLLPRPAALRP
jgi:DNA-binding PadR family transcriptional regulator